MESVVMDHPCHTRQAIQADNDVRSTTRPELEEARYEASHAVRRYEAVDLQNPCHRPCNAITLLKSLVVFVT